MDHTWDLSVLYKGFNDEAIAQDIQRMNETADRLEAVLSASSDVSAQTVKILEAATDCNEQLSALLEKLFSYASLVLSCDATNSDAQKMMDSLEMMVVRLQLISSEMDRFVGRIPDLDDVIAKSEKLKRVDFSLRRAAEQAAHTPDGAIQEWLLKMSLNGGKAFSNLRDKLDATHTVEYDGKSLPLSAVRAMAYDSDQQVRKAAYEAEIASYKKL